jgi:K+-transporting ATPase KdpF subunit
MYHGYFKSVVPFFLKENIKGDLNGCRLYRYHGPVFHALLRLCLFPFRGQIMMEDILVGAVAVCLIVYLFAALLRPDKF